MKERLRKRLQDEMAREAESLPNADVLASLLFHWFENQSLPATLKFNGEATKQAADEAEAAVPQQMRRFRVGDPILGVVTEASPSPDHPALNESQLSLLAAEHSAYVASWSWPRMLNYVTARLGLFVAVFTLCGIYLWYDHPNWLIEWRQYLTLLLLFSVATIAAYWLWRAPIRAEVVPIAIFAMVVTLLYR